MLDLVNFGSYWSEGVDYFSVPPFPRVPAVLQIMFILVHLFLNVIFFSNSIFIGLCTAHTPLKINICLCMMWGGTAALWVSTTTLQ